MPGTGRLTARAPEVVPAPASPWHAKGETRSFYL